jgi:hypothetical protein
MKHSIDYSKLENQVSKRAYRLEDVKGQLETVAFDIVRFKDSDKGAQLWQVQSADDGDYIVAIYQGEEEKTASAWEVAISKISGEIQFSYRGDPLVRVASAKLGIPGSELDKVSSYLPEKLATNKRLVQALLKEMPEPAKKMALEKYPELGQ